jgi:ATP-dependent DNA ligase
MVPARCAFDLLELDGEDLRRLPIEIRKARLPSWLRDAKGQSYETLAICRAMALARAAYAAAIAEKPVGRFMIRNRIRVVKRHPEGDW